MEGLSGDGGNVATWQLIERTSETLRRILQTHIDNALPSGNVLVQVASAGTFSELKSTKRPVVSVFLYRVVQNPELRNSPVRRLPDGSERRAPMVLELCYLITPWGARPDATPAVDEQASLEEHRLLGLVLQAFYEHAEVSRSELVDDPNPLLPRVWGDTDTVQLVLESLPIEDMYRIWDAGELSYRLSATYRARVLALDPTETRARPRVKHADFEVERAT